jgi:CheY-like chemotaxis protein
LLSNAGKFSPHRAPIVVRTWNPTPDWIELAIVDRGFGISREVLARLFEPFVQGENRQGARAGLGLGLALSRRLAELQGGSLTAESEGRGHGATFTLRLPTARALQESSTDTAPSASALEPPATNANHPLSILVIEDDASAARALRRLLTLDGHVVHVAENLAAAERIAGHEPLDVALADLHLGAESGLAAPRRLAEAASRSGRRAPPAIVLSGFDRDSDVTESRAAGFVAHLVKPVEEEALLRAVRRAADASPLT